MRNAPNDLVCKVIIKYLIQQIHYLSLRST